MLAELQVHASQSIEVIKEIPNVSGKGWKLIGKVSGIHENSMSTSQYILLN